MSHYRRVLLTFLRNALVREMTFRGNFLITVITRVFWFAAQLTLFELIYRSVPSINDWSRAEYFGFMATAMLINSLVETFFMPNCANFSELIRKGDLDFALLKPIDPQFLVSFERCDLGMLTQFALGTALLVYAVVESAAAVSFVNIVLYVLLIGCGVAFFYSLMIALAATSIWFGRNQGLYDFWFYVTIFARYPRSIYSGSPTGEALRFGFSYVIPILVVISVPARVLLAKTLEPGWLMLIAPGAAIGALFVSRKIFLRALRSYRSASS